jgi:predicted ATP-grasp superfamily ATP-dependent carboligase
MIRMARPASTGFRSIASVLVHEYVTGGGLAGQDRAASWRAEGAAMRRAVADDLAAAGCLVTMTLDVRDQNDEPGPRPHQVVPVGKGQEREILLGLAQRHDATLIIAPETAGVLADRALWLERTGARSLGSSSRAVALATDKRRVARLLRAAGLATPPDRVIDTTIDHVIDPEIFHDLRALSDGSVVVKPIDGAGSLDSYRVDGPRLAVPAALRDAGVMIVQPWLRGVPLSASFLVGAAGRVTLIGVGRQDIRVDAEGRITYEGGSVPYGSPRLARDAARAVRAVPGLAGWVGVDFLWDGHGPPVILDVNPRLTTSFVGLSRALPPGTLARALLASRGVGGAVRSRPSNLARRVHRRRAPVLFTPDGHARDHAPSGP